ncbi:barwin-like endoglucanase [Lojkania enalia]|uniref:Barwin-like endoglucanase n=1 Tax=Lojkania enalia TaxID=147567 RepID=A0A9P4K6K3_9PLEO|nr:barwin-like endoglucanase [Didymosphaeria enalia]
MMKSILFAAPFAAFAAANGPYPPCGPSVVYETVTEKFTVTVPAGPSVQSAPIPTTELEGFVTSTVYSTLWVTPSPSPFYPLSNGTFQPSYPTTLSTFVLPFSSDVDSKGSSLASAATSYPSFAAETSVLVSVSTAEKPAIVATSDAPAANPTIESPADAAPEESVDAGGDATIEGSNSGEATFYGGNVAGGMCSFTGYTIPSGIFGTALSDSNWAGAGNCGACVSVAGPDGNSIKAMVVDQCPGCGPNHLDLFPDAFAKLADPSKGVIPVSWSIVPCGITSPIVLKNKEGTSPYWFSMQVMNANVPVAKLEVSTDGGSTWMATTRQPYNFFEQASGFGTSSVDVRITSVSGGSIVVKGVSIEASSKTTATSNFS